MLRTHIQLTFFIVAVFTTICSAETMVFTGPFVDVLAGDYGDSTIIVDHPTLATVRNCRVWRLEVRLAVPTSGSTRRLLTL